MKTHLQENMLFDNSGDLAAISVKLNDLLDYIKRLYPDLIVSEHHEDNDDYGSEHFIKINGTCANIILKKNYGGMYCRSDSIDCCVNTRCFRNKATGIDHEFTFKNGCEPVAVSVGSHYAAKIKQYLDSHLQYLNADSSIYNRIDYKWHNDLSGINKLNTISFDLIYVSDEDFYVDVEQHNSYKSSELEKQETIESENPNDDFLMSLN